jgi:hypothetical protein
MRRALQRASRAAQSPAAAARLLDQATAASEEDRNHGIRIITQRKIQQQTNQTEEKNPTHTEAAATSSSAGETASSARAHVMGPAAPALPHSTPRSTCAAPPPGADQAVATPRPNRRRIGGIPGQCASPPSVGDARI